MADGFIKGRKQEPFNLKLIEEIKSYKCFWNIRDHKQFNNKRQIFRAWLSIAKKMNKEVSYLKSKWKNLKDTYRKELRKTLTSEDRSVWLYYEEMDFLRDSIPTEDIIEKNTTEYLEDSKNESQDDFDISESYVEDVKLEQDSFQSFHFEDMTSFTLDKDEEPPVKRIKRESESKTEGPLGTKDNYDEQFLVSLLPFLRSLDPIRKLSVRNKIQQAVLDELTRNIND